MDHIRIGWETVVGCGASKTGLGAEIWNRTGRSATSAPWGSIAGRRPRARKASASWRTDHPTCASGAPGGAGATDTWFHHCRGREHLAWGRPHFHRVFAGW